MNASFLQISSDIQCQNATISHIKHDGASIRTVALRRKQSTEPHDHLEPINIEFIRFAGNQSQMNYFVRLTS